MKARSLHDIGALYTEISDHLRSLATVEKQGVAVLEICLLGQFSLRREGDLILIPSRPAQSLFAYLSLHPDLTHRREKLAGMLWPEATDDNARRYLRAALWRIRKSLEEANVSCKDLLAVSDIEVRFIGDDKCCIDAAALLERKPAADWAIEELKEVVSLYRGELLPGFYDEWVVLERERVHAAYAQKMRVLLNLLLAQRQWEDALEWSERWIVHGHGPEPAYQALMIAHAGIGDLSSAITVYRRCRDHLRRDLGLEPSEELRALRQSLAKGEMPSLPMPADTPAAITFPPQPPTAGTSPYKGLSCFEVEDADRFYGRDRLTSKLVSRLRDHPSLLLIVGASGCGKSSLARAGLLPALQRGRKLADGTDPPPRSSEWLYRILTPGSHPLESLALALTQKHPSLQSTTSLIDDFARDPCTLHLASRKLTESAGNPHLLLLIDQFEEVFSLCNEEQIRTAFIENLMTAAEHDTGPTTIVLTLRADFYSHCSTYPELRAALAQRQEYIGAMSTEELRQAIEGPAQQGQWSFEPGLVDLILRDVRGEPGALPLLSHALQETWQRRSGKLMTLKGYAEAGGVHAAIAKSAETLYQGLSPPEQELTRGIFQRLTEMGVETQNTRRRAPIAELIISPDQSERVHAVLNKLADARLITMSKETAEVAHEALIREWPRLRSWLEEDRESLLLHRHLTTAAQEWEARDRDESELYRGTRLASARTWLKDHIDTLNPLEREFLEASKTQEQRELDQREQQRQRQLESARKLAETEARLSKRLRWFARGLSLLLVLAIIASGIALWQRDRAEKSAILTRARELASAAESQFNQDPQLSLLLSLEALDQAQMVDTEVPRYVAEALHQSVINSRLDLAWQGHDWRIYDTAFSPDDRLIATASFDGTVRLWQAQSGELLAVLNDGTLRPVQSLAFHPNGQLLATGSNDGTIRIWGSDNWQLVERFKAHPSIVFALDFSQDGRLLASAGHHGSAILWDTNSWRKLESFDGQFLTSVALSTDNRYLAAGGANIYVWAIDSGDLILELQGARGMTQSQVDPFIWALEFNPDSTRLYAADFHGVAKVFDVKTGETISELQGHADTIKDLAISSDGTRIATASHDRSVIVWEAATGEQSLVLPGHSSMVSSLDFDSTGTRLVSTTWEGDVLLWQLGPKRELATIPLPDTPTALAMSPDGTQVTVGTENSGCAYVFELQSGQRLAELDHGQGDQAITSTLFSPNQDLIATADYEGLIHLWDARTYEQVGTLEGHIQSVWDLAFSPDGELLASTGFDSLIKIWDIVPAEEKRTIQSSASSMKCIQFLSSQTELAGGDLAGPITIFDLNNASSRSLEGHQGHITELSLHPDGQRMASASADGTAALWEISSGKNLQRFSGHETPIEGLAISPDGESLITGSVDGVLRMWDIESGALRMEIAESTAGELVDLAVSPDGRLVVTAGAEGLHLIHLELKNLIELARARTFRRLSTSECQQFSLQHKCTPPTPAQGEPPDLLPATDSHRICDLSLYGQVNDGGAGESIHRGTLLVDERLGWDSYLFEEDFYRDRVLGLETLINENCDLIITPFYEYKDLVETAAAEHPHQRFVHLASGVDDSLENVWSQAFRVDQASFLAGYLSAGVTKTDKVATFGGAPIPVVLDFMIGFEQGVDYYNQQHNAAVEVIGWNSSTAEGEFIGQFCCAPEGRNRAGKLIEQGADVIFPVAGANIGSGALAAVQAAEGVLFIGVDVDVARAEPELAPWVLTSVVLRPDMSILHAAQAYEEGNFSGGLHTGTLENGEIELAPFYTNDYLISDELKAELAQIEEGIIRGEIETKPP